MLSILFLSDGADYEVRAKVNGLVAGQFPDKEKPSFLIPSQYGAENSENSENMKYKVKDILPIVDISKRLRT
jgi:hypothetical protein